MQAVVLSSQNFCSLCKKVMSLFSRGRNVNLLASFMSYKGVGGGQIAMGTALTRSPLCWKGRQGVQVKGEVGESKIRQGNVSEWVRVREKSEGKGKDF